MVYRIIRSLCPTILGVVIRKWAYVHSGDVCGIAVYNHNASMDSF